ncbi:MAG: XdhC family protein [Polaribacter sp.]|nr:XdhC family protein [Polaribacter sp.]
MKFWQYLLTKLQGQQHVYLLTVIENSGSSPGRKGFKMLIAQDGFIFGSVGGGVMEFRLVEEAQNLLKEETLPIFLKKQIHQGNIKDGSGMICSGEQTVVFHPLNSTHIPIIKNILFCLQNNQQKTICLSPSSFSLSDTQIKDNYQTSIQTNSDWSFNELIGFKNTLYIVGGGHVSLAVSELFVKLGFYVVVFDNRNHLNTFEDNDFAHHKQLVNYSEIENYITEGNDRYIAIMTNTYTDDKLVLTQLIRNNYKFVGVLGSVAKLKTMWTAMAKEGFSQKELNQVCAPIGIAIKSQTPDEIAISIAAQIIQVKNQQL